MGLHTALSSSLTDCSSSMGGYCYILRSKYCPSEFRVSPFHLSFPKRVCFGLKLSLRDCGSYKRDFELPIKGTHNV